VADWINPKKIIFFPAQKPHVSTTKKCPDIPQLSSYKAPPHLGFWRCFPFKNLPSQPASLVNFRRLHEIISVNRNVLSLEQRIRADRVVQDLQSGSVVPFNSTLPAIQVPNTASVAIHGEEFTDVLAWWILCGYVAGPFDNPPLPDFRTNAMMAVEQRDKIRIVMNLSGPKGESFNDAINELALEKVSMSSARLFGYSLVECGIGARMWKYDMVDAYKTIPAAQSDLRLQGFSWLGKYFVELKKVFGSKEAVSAYDRLNHTIVVLAAKSAKLPLQFIHRTLDDVPLVTPAASPAGPRFAAAYENICEQIGAKLAPPCEKFEKAFCDSTHGTVLGIRFDSISMSWSISQDKKSRTLSRLRGPFLGFPTSLLETQQLIGSLNDVGQMCPFLRGFRQPLYRFLIQFQDNPDIRLCPPKEVRDDLRVWAAAIHSASSSSPIPRRLTEHLPSALMFVSDASGAQFAKSGDMFFTLPYDGERGAASINAIEDDFVWFYAHLTWPRPFLLRYRDSMNHAYGCKSSTLEAIALILPFLCSPQILINREVTLLTDNEALVFGWEKRRVPHDDTASIFLRTLHLISCYLGTSVEVRHLPRMSCPSARLADALTHSSTTEEQHRDAVRQAPSVSIPPPLIEWLHHPSEDWSLPYTLLYHVQMAL